MKKANIGITEKNKKAVADQLSKILADEFVLNEYPCLYLKTH